MPSLAQLLTDHGSLLVLDAASTRIQVGLLRTGLAPVWHSTEEESGTGIFVGTQSVLQSSGFTLKNVAAFVFCEGPGSMLGIRTVAMAVRTWQVLQARPAYAYQSLAVAGGYQWKKTQHSVVVIADARRDSWHVQITGPDGQPGTLVPQTAAELPPGELTTPENFRAWSTPPRSLAHCSYDLAQVFPAIADGDYFRAIDSPDAFQPTAPEYKKWSAQIHQAPALPHQ